jgi:outer membrane protein assembly factor BamB
MLIVASPAVQAADDEWPMFQHDLYRTGSIASQVPDTNSCVWTFSIGASETKSPVYSKDQLFIGDVNGQVHCLNVSTGQVIWRYSGPHAFYGSPIVSDDYVVMAGFDGVVVFNRTSGGRVRTFDTDNTVVSSPLLADERIYAGSLEGTLYAWNMSGALLWSFDTRHQFRTSPALWNTRLFVGSDDGFLDCLNASTGDHLWAYDAGSWVRSGPVVANGIVFGGSKTDVFAVNATTGIQLWSVTVSHETLTSPAIAGNTLFVGANATVFAINASTGGIVWRHPLTTQIWYDSAAPAVADGKVFVSDTTLYCLNSSTGTVLWDYDVNNVMSSPVLGNNRVIVVTTHSIVYCLGTVTMSHTVHLEDETFQCSTVSSAIISDMMLDSFKKILRFSGSGKAEPHKFCNITFPTELLGGPFTVILETPGGDTEITPQISTNATHTSVYFVYPQSAYCCPDVEVIGSTIKFIFPTGRVLLGLIPVFLVALMLLILKLRG